MRLIRAIALEVKYDSPFVKVYDITDTPIIIRAVIVNGKYIMYPSKR